MAHFIKRFLNQLGYDIVAMVPPPPPVVEPALTIPDGEFYRPVFSPWLGYGRYAEFIHIPVGNTLVSPDRCYVLWILARQALALGGEMWECGVYRGGTAALLAATIADAGRRNVRLRLFDTFEGMPQTDAAVDVHHQAGDFADTSADAVRARLGGFSNVDIHKGWIPETFKGLEQSRVALAHVDVDIYRSVLDCCEFIYPRLAVGGFLVFDDYGFPTCPGARKAVDEYFATRRAVPLVMPTGQALVFKSRDE